MDHSSASEYGDPVTRGYPIASKAPNRAAVDAFYAAATANRAKDNGKPRLRTHFHPNEYCALVIDLHGNRIEDCATSPNERTP